MIPTPVPEEGYVFSKWAPVNPEGHMMIADVAFVALFAKDGGSCDGGDNAPPANLPMSTRIGGIIRRWIIWCPTG